MEDPNGLLQESEEFLHKAFVILKKKRKNTKGKL
jgi:hypothetical protein